MNNHTLHRSCTAALAIFATTFATGAAEQTTGVPGSAGATTTISGKQLPAPDPKFGGVINDGALQSKAWWAPRIVWSNTIGAPELIAVWKDPDFDAKQRAFYYGRVIEIPMPRWTAYDAQRFGVKMAKEVPMTTTERAYTSPIWYTP